MDRKKLIIFQNCQRKNFIHHFVGLKVFEEKKIYILILKYHFITIQTEFIIAVRHFINTVLIIMENVSIRQ